MKYGVVFNSCLEPLMKIANDGLSYVQYYYSTLITTFECSEISIFVTSELPREKEPWTNNAFISSPWTYNIGTIDQY